MPVDGWSISAGPLKIEELKSSKDGYVELARLTGLPPSVILTAKATFRSSEHGKPKTDWSTIRTVLYMGPWLVDESWCNLFAFDAGATTVALHGAVDLPELPGRMEPEPQL